MNQVVTMTSGNDSELLSFWGKNATLKKKCNFKNPQLNVSSENLNIF